MNPRNNSILQDAKSYFYKLHDIEVNQKYADNLPYSFHLSAVESQGIKFIHLINETCQAVVFIGIYGHDSIEDARLTYNNIVEKYGVEAAEIIYLCTEYKGRNREERKPESFYVELSENKLAVFVKLCDLIANIKFSLLTNSTMYNKYKKEYNKKVRRLLYCEEYSEMFEYIDKLILF